MFIINGMLNSILSRFVKELSKRQTFKAFRGFLFAVSSHFESIVGCQFLFFFFHIESTGCIFRIKSQSMCKIICICK